MHSAATPPSDRQSFTRENAAYNRSWFAQLRERVQAGEPFAYIHINTPTEIFQAMGIHVVVNQWWSAVVGSRGRAQRYRDLLVQRGYRQNLCSYCAAGLSSLLEQDPAEAVWGGLPRPTVLVSGSGCLSVTKIFDLFATEFGIPHFVIDMATNPRSIALRVSAAADHWRDCYDPRQIDLYVEQYKGLIRFLEMTTGRLFSESRFRRIMELVDEQESYYRRTRDLIAAARPTPLSIADQLPATIIPQWHRGTEWARDRARLFYEQTARLVAAGHAACPGERIRLMWLGVGLWHDLDFYSHFQQRYGAVFAWNEYLALAADGYRVALGDDLLATLAGRMCNVMSVVAQDTWYVEQYRQAGLDGVIVMAAAGARQEGGLCPNQFGRPHRTIVALRRAGFPVCIINADPVSAAGYDDAAIRLQVGRFLEDEVVPRLARREH